MKCWRLRLAVVAIDNRSTRRPVGVVGGGVSSRGLNGFSMRPLEMAVFPAKGAFFWARESALTDSGNSHRLGRRLQS